jgi:hypothetical protein
MIYALSLIVTIFASVYLNGTKLRNNWLYFLVSFVPVLNTVAAVLLLGIIYITKNFKA